MRHVILELLELHPRLLDSLLRLLGADRIDDQEDDDQREERSLKRQLNSSKLHH